jgi:DNA polymerase V
MKQGEFMSHLKQLRKRKPGAGRKPNPIPTKAIRLPLPLVDQLLALKDKEGGFEGLYRKDIGEIFAGKISSSLRIPLYESRIQAGFPSPTDELSEGLLDLNEYLVPHRASTFFVRVTGDSMTGVGIFPEDMLIVDRSLTANPGKIVIAVLNGEMTVKRLEKEKAKLLLCAENEKYPDIVVTEEDSFSVWGVVTNVIHSLM